MAQAKRDENRVATLIGVSSVDTSTPTLIAVDPATNRLLVSAITSAGAEYAEDSVHASGDLGIMLLAVRQDTQVDFGADGDYVPLSIDENGALRVTGGGTQYAVDAALGATPTGTLAVAIRDDALSTLTPVEGDAIGLRVDANGALWTRDDVLEAALSGSELQVDVVAALPAGTNAIGKLAANSGVDIGDVDVLSVIPGTGATNLGKAIDAVAGATDTGVVPLAIRDDALSALTPVEGDYVGLRTDANGALWVHDDALDAALAGSELQVDIVAALPASTNAIGKLAANSGVDIGDVDVTSAVITGGSVADDGTTPGNPIMVGGFAISPDGTTPGSVSAEADVARFRTDLNRRLLINDEHPQWWSYHEDSSSALTDASVQAAPGANLQIVITSIIVSTGAATALNFFLEEATTKVFGPIYLEAVAGRGFVSGPIKKHITTNTAVTITTSAAIAHSIDIQGYIQAV